MLQFQLRVLAKRNLNPNRRSEIVNVHKERRVFRTAELVFIAAETIPVIRKLVVAYKNSLLVDILSSLLQQQQKMETPPISNQHAVFYDVTKSFLTLTVLMLMFTLAGPEQVTLKSKSWSGFSGTFRKLICRINRSSFLDRLKVNW